MPTNMNHVRGPNVKQKENKCSGFKVKTKEHGVVQNENKVCKTVSGKD
jgi:hypothetical protein